MAYFRRFYAFIKKNKGAKTVVSNTFSLYIIKALSTLFPLIIIPLVLNKVGDENYGKYVYSFAIIQYLKIIINYGFQFTGTRDIAKANSDKTQESTISTEIICLRLAFAIITSIILFAIGLFYNEDKWLYILGIGSLFGFAMQATWYYQGIQKMHIMSLLVLSSKIVVIILIFFFIRDKHDYIYLNLIDSAGYLISGFISLLIMRYQYNIRLLKPNLKQIINQLKIGFKLFLSTVFISFYREANTIILAQFADFKVVGYYAIAEKIIKSIQSISQPITQALFPYFTTGISHQKGLSLFNKIGKYIGIVFLFITILIALFSNYIIYLYLGEGYDNVVWNLIILSPVVFAGILNYYIGIIGLVNRNKDGKFTVFVSVSGIINIILCIILSKFFSDIGASISLTIAELSLFFLLINYWGKSHKNID